MNLKMSDDLVIFKQQVRYLYKAATVFSVAIFGLFLALEALIAYPGKIKEFGSSVKKACAERIPRRRYREQKRGSRPDADDL